MSFFAMIWAVLLGIAHADDTGLSCENWGEISPSEPGVVVLTESFTFYVGGGFSCGDLDSCSWWLDEPNSVGSISPSVGSPIEFTAPDLLDECIPQSFQLFLSCEDQNTLDTVELTVECTERDKYLLLQAEGSTVGGGGCMGASTSAALLLIPLLVFRRSSRFG